MNYYLRELERFDIDKFIAKACAMTWIDLLKECISECTWLDKRRVSGKYEDEHKKYVIAAYRLQTDQDFIRKKPIIEALVSKKQLKPEVRDDERTGFEFT